MRLRWFWNARVSLGCTPVVRADRQQTHLGRNHEHRLLLTATLIRYQLIMKQVYPAHQELFGKTVRDRVNSETSGTYFSLLMEIMETVETHF